jgi:hypothetical protein
MPLEIRELQITVTVNQQQAKEAAAAAPGSQDAKDEKGDIMKQCIDDIMNIINNKKER